MQRKLATFALIFLAFLASTQGVSLGQGPSEPRIDSINGNKDDVFEPFLLPTIQDLSEVQTTSSSTANALLPHWVLSQATPQWIMAITGVWALLLSGLAAALLKWTLDATRQSIRTADEAVVVTRQIGEAQVRAYLTCPNMEYAISTSLIKIGIEVQNTGQFPARNIQLGGDLYYEGTLYKLGQPSKHVRHRLWLNGGRVADIPGNSVGDGLILFHRNSNNGADFDGLVKNRNGLNFNCFIAWTDVFDKRQTAEFAFGISSANDDEIFAGSPDFKRRLTGFQRPTNPHDQRRKPQSGHG